MGSDAYIEYINSEKWANKRAHKLLLSKQHCEGCKATPQSFHVHHLTYANLFNELMSDLMVLCERCHKMAEYYIRRGTLSRTGDTGELRKLTRELLRPPNRTTYKPSVGAIVDRFNREQERLRNIQRHQKGEIKKNRKPISNEEAQTANKHSYLNQYGGGRIPRIKY